MSARALHAAIDHCVHERAAAAALRLQTTIDRQRAEIDALLVENLILRDILRKRYEAPATLIKLPGVIKL